MNRLVEINLGKGNLEEGFSLITVQLDKKIQLTGNLNPAPQLIELYSRWQLLYQSFYESRRFKIRNKSLKRDILEEENDNDFDIDDADITHISEEDFTGICEQIKNTLNDWLSDKNFLNIERKLRQNLSPNEEIRFILQSEDYQVKKIPWLLWQFFEDYPLTEVALSSLNFEPRIKVLQQSIKVKILAILGDSTGINVEKDRQILSNLPNAETIFLIKPTREELFEKLWDEKGWDLLFFSGHSETNKNNYTGYIYLNSQEKLTIQQLKNALQKAIENGLQLAILNSCDGLGLGKSLADLFIPQTVLMREPISDKVAQKFLQYFLQIFSSGQSFYLSVKEARERLQALENDFPCASWLPIIWQNPAEIPPTWQDLQFTQNSIKHKIKKILAFSGTILTFILGFLGIKSDKVNALEIPSDETLKNLGNSLQQNALDLQQLGAYLDAENANQIIEVGENFGNLANSLQQKNLPSLDEVEAINNDFQQVQENFNEEIKSSSLDSISNNNNFSDNEEENFIPEEEVNNQVISSNLGNSFDSNKENKSNSKAVENNSENSSQTFSENLTNMDIEEEDLGENLANIINETTEFIFSLNLINENTNSQVNSLEKSEEKLNNYINSLNEKYPQNSHELENNLESIFSQFNSFGDELLECEKSFHSCQESLDEIFPNIINQIKEDIEKITTINFKLSEDNFQLIQKSNSLENELIKIQDDTLIRVNNFEIKLDSLLQKINEFQSQLNNDLTNLNSNLINNQHFFEENVNIFVKEITEEKTNYIKVELGKFKNNLDEFTNQFLNDFTVLYEQIRKKILIDKKIKDDFKNNFSEKVIKQNESINQQLKELLNQLSLNLIMIQQKENIRNRCLNLTKDLVTLTEILKNMQAELTSFTN